MEEAGRENGKREEQNLIPCKARPTAIVDAATQLRGSAKVIRSKQTIAKAALCPQQLPTNDRLDEPDCSIKTLISNLD